MQDKIILGILTIGPASMYSLMKALQNSTEHFYTTSTGSIHPALKKLEKNGLVTSETSIENGRARKIFTITIEGHKVYKEWAASDISIGKIKDESLVHLFFLSANNPVERIKLIKKYIKNVDSKIKELTILQNEGINNCKQIPEHLEDIAFYQLATLDYGIDYYKFQKKWYQNLLKTIQSKLNEK